MTALKLAAGNWEFIELQVSPHNPKSSPSMELYISATTDHCLKHCIAKFNLCSCLENPGNPFFPGTLGERASGQGKTEVGGCEGGRWRAGEIIWGFSALLDLSRAFGHLFSSVLDWGTKALGLWGSGYHLYSQGWWWLRSLNIGLCGSS